jgi:hypothetical protein
MLSMGESTNIGDTMTFTATTNREKFLIGEALALAIATDCTRSEREQRPSDRADMIDVLCANFPPAMVAFHSFSACSSGDLPMFAYYEGEMQGGPEHAAFWSTIANLTEAREAASASDEDEEREVSFTAADVALDHLDWDGANPFPVVGLILKLSEALTSAGHSLEFVAEILRDMAEFMERRQCQCAGSAAEREAA